MVFDQDLQINKFIISLQQWSSSQGTPSGASDSLLLPNF